MQSECSILVACSCVRYQCRRVYHMIIVRYINSNLVLVFSPSEKEPSFGALDTPCSGMYYFLPGLVKSKVNFCTCLELAPFSAYSNSINIFLHLKILTLTLVNTLL